MAVKVDKEFLLKHRFWILTGVFVILALVPLFLLTTSVSDEVAKKRDEYDKAKKAVEGITSPMNDSWVTAYNVKDKFVSDKRDEVHGQAWRSQENMMTYPESLKPIMKDKYFGDTLVFTDLDKFARDYQSQLGSAVVEVQPLLPLEGYEKGVVQFPGGSIDGVLRLSVQFTSLPPSKEDFWLAQEDLWVKRELLRIIRDANDSVARFHAADEEQPVVEKKQPEPANPAKPAADASVAGNKPAADASAAENKPADGATPPAPKPAAKPIVKKSIDLNHRVFRNQHWELDLTLKQGLNDQKKPVYKVSGTIKNIGKRQRPLGIDFKVLLQDGPDPAGIILPVDREPLAVGETWTIPPTREFSADQIAFDGLHGVEEVLTWRTAPVKRIDVIELGYSSSRMANRTLKPPRWYVPPVAAETTAGPEGAGGPPTGMGGKMGMMGMGGATGGAVTTTKNGMVLNRYIDTNEQVRHMPVGMVVIADDEHLAELLSAFTNSRLRIQVTQSHWQVCRDKLAPQSEEPSTGPGAPAKGGNIGVGPGRGGKRGGDEIGSRGGANNGAYRNPSRGGGKGFPGASMPGNLSGSGMQMPSGPGGFRSGPGGMPGGMPGRNSFGSSEGDDEENLNLLEVAIYGVASLYERFPPKPPAPEGAAADASGQPATPPKP
ncbi:MAG TPA: hypothetical protein VGP68_05815 [Gemmataceae bacterium]|nr:hypothetical protein [Gemmataceae bacterium]